MTLSVALKEWDLVIRGILAGRQVVLLRKGGILESNNEFELEHKRFLFYPTFIHQDQKMVKAEFRGGLIQTREEPNDIEIAGWGEVAKIVEVPSRKALEALSDLYVWDSPLLDMRFAYRPEKPLYLAIVRGHRLASSIRVKNSLAYAGCKSWVPRNEEISIDGSRPVLAEDHLQALVARVEQAMTRENA